MFSHFDVGLVLTITVVVGAVVSRESSGFETDVTLPEPRIVMMGVTGAGKSSLGNVLLGGPPECKDDQINQPLNCWFGVCHSASSCTKGTQYGWGKFAGVGDNSTVIDTPGFGDSDNDDNILITEMVDALKNSIKTANTFLLTFNGQSERFDTLLQQMLREVEALFGTGFWDHVVLEATHWSFNAIIVEDRDPDAEEHWCQSINTEIQKNFVHVTQNFPCVFIDSFAKKGSHVDDQDEQEAFQRETQELWDLTKQFGPFEFKSLEDVLADLYQCREERDCLDGIIAGDLKTMKEDITAIWTHVNEDENTLEAHALRMESIEAKDTAQDKRMNSINATDTTQDGRLDSIEAKDITQDGLITGLRTDVDGLRTDVDGLRTDSDGLRTDVDGLRTDVDGLRTDVDGLNKDNKTQDGLITGLRTDVDGLRTDVDGLSMAPIGTIVAWSPKPNKDFLGKLESVPPGWVECDGKPISEGIWDGFATPDLNSNGHFLRGAAHYDDVLEEQAGQVEKHSHGYTEHAHSHSYYDRVYKGYDQDDCTKYPADTDPVGGAWTAYETLRVENDKAGYDKVCKAKFTTDDGHDDDPYSTKETGSDETVPINVKVIFIMKIK